MAGEKHSTIADWSHLKFMPVDLTWDLSAAGRSCSISLLNLLSPLSEMIISYCFIFPPHSPFSSNDLVSYYPEREVIQRELSYFPHYICLPTCIYAHNSAFLPDKMGELCTLLSQYIF